MTGASLPENAYAQGLVEGQIVTYCEQIRKGSRLLAQVAFPASFADAMFQHIANEGCKVSAEFGAGPGRVKVLIYRDNTAREIFHALSDVPNSPLGMFVMGKLFGYADSEVLTFIREALADPESTEGRDV